MVVEVVLLGMAVVVVQAATPSCCHEVILEAAAVVLMLVPVGDHVLQMGLMHLRRLARGGGRGF